MTQEMDQSARVALVTGASRGIGRAIAMALGQQGYTVIGTATTEAGAKDISGRLSTHHIKGAGLVLDVRSEESCTHLVKHITDTYGAPLILINNAGVTHDNLLMRMKEDQWTSVIETNLTSAFRLVKACSRGMLKARWGRIVNISSVVGATGNPGQINYVASKAGLIGLTKSAALELASIGVTVNAVAPGFIQTDMTEALNEKQKEAILSRVPVNRLGMPEDIAYAVNFLVSDQASYITGQTIHVNGGMFVS